MFYKIITLLTFLIFCISGFLYFDHAARGNITTVIEGTDWVERDWFDGKYRKCNASSGGVACTAWDYAK